MTDLIGWALTASAVTLAAVVLAMAYVAAYRGDGSHRRPGGAPSPDVAQAPKVPDPYVWRGWKAPSARDARWRRWSRRARASMYGPAPLPPLAEEPHLWGLPRGWRPPSPVRRAYERSAPFEDEGAMVRPYVHANIREREHS